MRVPIALVIALILPLVVGGAGRATQSATPVASRPDLSGIDPLPLTGERRAAFEAYVADALHRFGVPGASVAVVQNGEVVYLNGFGVTELGGVQPVTPDTMMMIGSITKSMTTMMTASAIDDGRLTWDTRLVNVLPNFAVADPELTRSLTMRDAFCNCSGLPGRQIAAFFESAEMTPEDVVAELADVAPVAAPGEAFLYNNLLISAGGYAAGVAAEKATSNLGLSYDTAMQSRIFGPLGMIRSTFDFEEVLAGGDYALPHGVGLTGELQAIPLSAERGVVPVRPAGGLWSNAREMGRYLQTLVAGGVAPNRVRVVSEERLEEMWQPGVAFPPFPGMPPLLATSMDRYGLGWISGEYHGQRVISHAGGTSGFAAQLAILPEADLGIVVLSNALAPAASYPYFPFAIEIRLFELLFEQPAEIDAQYQALAAEAAERPRPALDDVDREAIAPYLGQYAHPELGNLQVLLLGERLIMLASTLGTELRPPAGNGEGTTFLMVDPPLSLFSEAGATVSFVGGAEAPELRLTIPANPIGPEQQIEFEHVRETGKPTG